MPIKSPYPSVEICSVPVHKFVLDAIWRHSVERPHDAALVSVDDPRETRTFRDIWVSAHSVAAFLRSRNFGHRDIACIVLPNNWQFAVFFLSAGLCGGATSGASALFTDYELERQFLDSGCKVVLTDEQHLSKVVAAAKKCPKISVPDYQQLHFFSGTTGSPKGVMLSHRNFGTMYNIYSTHANQRMTKLVDPDFKWAGEHFLLFLPFYHAYGFSLLINTLTQGATGVVFSHFDPVKFVESIQRYKIRIVALVPPVLVLLAKHPLCSKYDLSSMQAITCGAAPAGKEIVEEVTRRYPGLKYIRQDYQSAAKHGSAGKLAPNLELKIVNLETGEELGPGEKGEICVRGPTVMLGYLNRPDATAETIDGEGWLHTGDIGYVDTDGELFIVDRLKELIKVKGLQVPPAELEDLLLSHPRIRDAAVIGIPDSAAGELPRAYVVRADHELKEQDVDDFVKERVSHYKFLRGGVRFVSEIPKSAAGKILRRFLRDQAKAEMEKAKI